MLPDRGRTKKLILAYHFYSSNPAGWSCEECRRNGLEARRRCGWLAEPQRGAPRIVWAKDGVASDECPKPAITAASIAWLEMMPAGGRREDLSAKDEDALALLEREQERARYEQ